MGVVARNYPHEERLFSCHCEARVPKQSLEAIVRLLHGVCPEYQEILRYAQNDTKRRARSDSLNC